MNWNSLLAFASVAALLLPSAEAAPTFTGDVATDFAIPDVIAILDPSGIDDYCSLVLDFDYDADGDTILAGQDLSEVYSGYGIDLVTWNTQDMSSEGLGIAFDSSNPTGGDTDLATPGYGDGNDTALGNLLISAENFTDSDGDGYIDDPDDDANGAWFEFFFDTPTCVATFDLIDVETTESPIDVIMWDIDGYEIAHIQAYGTGDNSVVQVVVDVCDVAEMMIDIYGSGAIDNIDLCPEE